MGDLAILSRFQGTLVHDGWIAYRALEYEHSLCNIHHVRELPHVHDDLGQDRAVRMTELLTETDSQDHRHRAAGQIDYAAPGNYSAPGPTAQPLNRSEVEPERPERLG